MKRVFAILLVMMLCIAMLPATAFAGSKTVYIINNGTIYLRAGAGRTYEALGTVKHGDTVSVKGSSGEWSKVKVARTGKTGWIKTMYFDGTTKWLGTGIHAIKTSTTLNLRRGPSTSYSIKSLLYPDDTVKVMETENSWAKVTVSADGLIGWIPIKYVGEIVTPSPAVTVVPASQRKVYHVTASALNLRKGPGTSYAKVGVLYSGQAVAVLMISGNWYKVFTPYGAIGWVSRNYLSAGATARVTTNSSGLNVRTGPGTSYAVLGSVPKGSYVTVTKINKEWKAGHWAYIMRGSLAGYASLTYLTF